MSGYFRGAARVHKMAKFNRSALKWFRSIGLSTPLDKVALFFTFIVMAYVPVLVWSAIISPHLFSKKQMDPKNFQYNVPDGGELANILKALKDIKSELEELKKSD